MKERERERGREVKVEGLCRVFGSTFRVIGLGLNKGEWQIDLIRTKGK